MESKNRATITLLIILSFIFACSCKKQHVETNSEINNLVAFTKLYGLIRYFHSSDEASKLNWEKFAVYGVKEILGNDTSRNIKQNLKQLFLFTAPTLQIYSQNNRSKVSSKFEFNKSANFVSWQHYGVYLSEKSNIYKSYRVNRKFSLVKNIQSLSKSNREILDGKLFAELPGENEVYSAKLNDTLEITFPLSIGFESKKVNQHNKDPFNQLNEKISHINHMELTGNNKFVRLANVIIAWNVFQHFYPYFDVIDIDWNKVLVETLEEAMQEQTSDDFYFVLSKMVAKLRDGHGYVLYTFESERGGLPIRVEYIEKKLVVTASKDSLIKRGDIIKKVDGKDAIKYLDSLEQYVPGSTQLRRYRALNQFISGDLGDSLNLCIVRSNRELDIEVSLDKENRGFFFNPISEFDFPDLKEIENEIFYVNLNTTDTKKFMENLDEMSEARGIVFDTRWDGELKKDFQPINLYKIVAHIIKGRVEPPEWYIPEVIYPNRKRMKFYKSESWGVMPQKPRLSSKIVFIIDPHVVSSAETYMSIVEHYKLAEIVGERSAGVNGNVNFIPLIGGYEIMFTGMKVLKQDGSQHNLIGIEPNYPIERTIKAVKEGRDEYLEKAIEIIKTKEK